MPLLVVVGSGPGISQATAERFGRDGWDVALIGRSRDRLDRGVEQLRATGVRASAHPSDASDPRQIVETIRSIRAHRGPVAAVLWTAFRGGDVADVLEARPEDVARVFDVGVVGLLAVTRAVREDLIAASGALLVANGAVGDPTPQGDRFATALGIDGTALENAAKSKLVGILAERLRADGVHVGQITVAGSVRGTATAGPAAIDPAEIAERFWAIAHTDSPARQVVGEHAV